MPDKAELIHEAILKANKNLEETFRRGDPRAMAALYTESAVLMPTGSEPIEGTAAIGDFWEAALHMGIKDFRIETQEVDAQGATVIEAGRYTLSGENGRLIDQGKYVVIWKLVQGEWKLHRDIWNTSLSHH